MKYVTSGIHCQVANGIVIRKKGSNIYNHHIFLQFKKMIFLLLEISKKSHGASLQFRKLEGSIMNFLDGFASF